MALLLCDSKLNMFGLQTKQDIWGFHLGLLETLIATFTAAYSEFCRDASCLITRHLRHQTRLIFVSFPQYPGWHELVILAAQNWSHTGSWICFKRRICGSASYLDHIFLSIDRENNRRVRWHQRKHAAPFNLSDSPHDETCDDGDPGDAAGLGPFAVFVHVLAAAAQADQVHGQNQQAQNQTHGSDACQKYQRLRAGEGKEAEVRESILFWRASSLESTLQHITSTDSCCCCCVVWSCQAGWPRRPKARQHWVKTTHRHQTTLVCEDMCSRPLISIITADCCKGDRKQSGGWFGVTRSPPPRGESRFLQDCERLREGKKTEMIWSCGRGASCDTLAFTQSCDFWAWRNI